MRKVLWLAWCFAAITPGVSGHKSFRIAAMTRGYDVNNTDPNVIGGSSHDCYRECVDGDVRTCQYSFTVTEYTAMGRTCGDCPFNLSDCSNAGCITAGGFVRPVIVANAMLPGPSIQVCQGDTVEVEVINALSSHSTTIHWHGAHQYNTPYMDGTPYLTQCPIHPHNSFTYTFEAQPVGTHIWHSHSGFEEADGLYGSFIVRTADDPLAQYYDYDLPEHIIAVWHWYYEDTASVLKTKLHTFDSVYGFALTVNGLASLYEYELNDAIYMTPRAEFTVTQNYTYRFRMMYNSAIYCPLQVSIDSHTLLVIASEGGTFEPVEVESLVINAGERFDFVLRADQEIGNYWIRFRGFGNCISWDNTILVKGEAILRYSGGNDTADPEGTITYEDARRSGVLLNPVQVGNETYTNNTLIRLVDLTGTSTNQPNISGTPDHIIYLQYSYNYYYEFHSPGPFPQINFRSFEFPPIPLLTQYEDITEDMYCTENDLSASECVGNYCTCPYVYPVGLDSLVEIVIVDMGLDRFDDHPMHLHGHNFQIVAMESIGGNITFEYVKEMNEAGLIEKKFEGSVAKDNVGVPAQGFIVLRFIANNPGYWFFHCHVSNHAEMGMGIVIKVGEHSDMVQPPSSFPRCGNWDVYTSTSEDTSSSSSSSSSSSKNFVSYNKYNSLTILALMILRVIISYC